MRRLMGLKHDQGLPDRRVTTESPAPGMISPLGDHTNERVFPARKPQVNEPIIHKMEANKERFEYSAFPTSPGGDGSSIARKSSKPQLKEVDDQPRISERAQYIHSNTGPPRVVSSAIADRHKPSLRRCEDEPIHLPGAIQSFGALLGLRYSDDKKLEVRVASENCRKILGYGPEQLFALPSFLDVLRQDIHEEITARISHALRNVHATQKETHIDVFQLILTFPFEPEIRLWCAIHLAPSPPGMVICEFEEFSDAFYLKDIGAARVLPSTPAPNMGFGPSPQELAKSTTSYSKPLPVLEIARRKKNKEFSALDLFNAMTQAQKQIEGCNSLKSLFEVVVGIISELTGFHRVMFYRFDSQRNGVVEAELLIPQASPDVFRGMHFPASDIPNQARELYIINRIRLLHDRDAETARLVSRNRTDFKQPLDLTHSYLRAISPVHLKYLANMGVRATMSISIVIDGDLWGLIACHGYGDFGTRVSLPIREVCRTIGECAAANIERIMMQQRVEARRSTLTNPIRQNPSGNNSSPSSDLLRLVDADFALLSMDDESKAIGKPEPYREALAIISYLQSCQFTELQHSKDIKADFPGFSYPPGITLGGLLFIPLGSRDNNDFIAFFRKAQQQEMKWAGNPHESKYKANTQTLEPRTSFAQWVETAVIPSKEWTEDQLDTGKILALLYGRFADIWRQKSLAGRDKQMSLINKSSNEAQTPLHEIINYLEMALEHNADDYTRIIVGEAQKASKSLVQIIENLSKLTESEETSKAAETTFNLKITASKILHTLQKEAKRKALDLTVSVDDRLPAMVKGNSKNFKQLIVYFMSNGFKQSVSVKVDLNFTRTKDNFSTIELLFQDSGPGMSDEELDDIFQQFQEVQGDDTWPLPSKLSGSSQDDSDVGSSVDVAAIAQYVRNSNGQIQVNTEIGKGTLFSVELMVELSVPAETAARAGKFRNILSSLGSSPKGLSPPPFMKGPSRPLSKG